MRGGTGNAIIAANPSALKARLTEIIRNIQADKLAFTAPAITAKVGEGGFLYQAQFQYSKPRKHIQRSSISKVTQNNTHRKQCVT